MKTYDLIIIGGGAAGQMAAISARRNHPGFSIAIIDRTFSLGRKILIAGAGRCNITNINLNESIDNHYYGAHKDFIKSIFDQFNYDSIVKFFNDLGAELYVERKTNIGKVFPVTDQAKTISEMLLDELLRNNIDIYFNTECKNIIPGAQFTLETEQLDLENSRRTKLDFSSKYIILSAGGKTYPSFGSNGSGYDLARALKHNIIKPVPSALPLEGKNFLSQLLQGQKHEIEATSIIEGKEIKTRTDDVMFKKYGLSGPAILNISREISIYLNRENKKNVQIKLNFFPGKGYEEVEKILKERWKKRPTQEAEKSLYGLFPNKIAGALVEFAEISNTKQVKDLTDDEIHNLIQKLTATIIPITETRGWMEAEFTAGGVDTRDVKPATLESKKVPRMYFAGEVLDVDGDVGGFNLSWSWASGNTAGKLQ